MKLLWKILSFVSIGCGVIAYFVGWFALLSQATIGSISTEFWFYDAMASGLFGLFFLIYGVHGAKK